MTVKTWVPHRPSFLRLCAVVIAPLSVFAASSAQAQVIEIGSQGAVTVYDGPAVVTAAGVTAIGRPASAARTARRVNASPPSRPAPLSLAGAISDAARASDVSASLIAAIAWRESNFRASAVSRAGALGEMQLLPSTARALGVDPRVSRQNVAGGAAYIRALLQRYHGDLIKTLAAYNAGPEAVDRYGGVPPFKETKAYVAAVLDRLSEESVDQGLDRPTGLLVVSETGR
jgi:soluble lytic murein transglycosylase-like protein